MPGFIESAHAAMGDSAPLQPYADLMQQTGLTEHELQQVVTFGERGSAPLGDVLMDPKCPVGGWIKQAYEEGGREAVEGKIDTFNDLAPEFHVALGEEAKKKPSSSSWLENLPWLPQNLS
jgi:hypothetical protein